VIFQFRLVRLKAATKQDAVEDGVCKLAELSWKRAATESAVRPTNVDRISCSEAPRAGGANGSPLAAIKLRQRDAICKRDDVVRLGMREAARPPGAAYRPAVSFLQ